jgi:hypothetical protein
MYLIRGEPTTPRAAVRPMSTEYDPVPGHRGGRDRVGAELTHVTSRGSPVRGRLPPGRACGRCQGHGNAGAAVSGSGWRGECDGDGRRRAWLLVRAAEAARLVPGPGVCSGGAGRPRSQPSSRRAPPHSVPTCSAAGLPRPVPWPRWARRGRQEAAPRQGGERPGRSGFIRMGSVPAGQAPKSLCRSASTTYGHPLPGELLSNHPHPHLFTLRTVEALHKAWRAGWSPSPRSPSTPESRRAR